MTHVLELARRAARFRATPLVTLATLFGACNATDNLTSTSEGADVPADVEATPAPSDVSLSSSFRGGIPIGYFGQPTEVYGATYNGGFRSSAPSYLTKTLAGVKARGGRMVVNFAGHERNYKTGGKFNLTKWKARVAAYRNVNFSQYINDGTIIAHYLIDEPGDPHNWGHAISGATLEEMARYSKQLWPNLPTVVRADASYLANFSTKYRYLDAAWAQYVTRKGSPSAYISRNIKDAQRKGLALITGLNVTRGGPNKRQLSASQIKSYGAALLASSYPCAFISWDFKSSYTRGSVHDAMRYLAGKAQSRASRSCRSGPAGEKPGPIGDKPRPRGEKPPRNPAPLPRGSGKGGGIVLTASKATVKRHIVVTLKWRGAAGRTVKFYRNGVFSRNTANDGRAKIYPQRKLVFRYRICEAGKSRCSNTVTVAAR
jgi:hypothetical protein